MKSAAKSIGDRVKERRRALGLSQPQLAKKVGGITYQAIQQLEGGGGSRHLVGIARALGVTAEWLQDGVGPTPPKLAAARPGAAEKLKVLGMAECGADGWSLWNGDVIDLIDQLRHDIERALGFLQLGVEGFAGAGQINRGNLFQSLPRKASGQAQYRNQSFHLDHPQNVRRI